MTTIFTCTRCGVSCHSISGWQMRMGVFPEWLCSTCAPPLVEVSVPAFIVERNARFAREREEREEHLHAQGYKLLHCVAVHDPRDGTRLMTTWVGETERFVLVHPPSNYLGYGVGCVLVGPDSRLVPEHEADQEGPVLTVFRGTKPR